MNKFLFLFFTLAISFSMIQAKNPLVKVNRDYIVEWDKAKLIKFFGAKYLDCWKDQQPNYYSQEELWNVLNLEVLKKDENVKKAFEVAVAYLLKFGVKKCVLQAKADYSVLNVNIIEQSQADDTLYFDINFVNDCDKKDIVRLAASVIYNKKTCKYEVEEDGALAINNIFPSGPITTFLDHYYKTSLTWKEFQKSKEVQEIFLYGLNTLVKKAIKAKILKTANYYVDLLYVAAISPSKHTTYYLFDAYINTQTLGYAETYFIVKSYKGKLTLENYTLFNVIE